MRSARSRARVKRVQGRGQVGEIPALEAPVLLIGERRYVQGCAVLGQDDAGLGRDGLGQQGAYPLRQQGSGLGVYSGLLVPGRPQGQLLGGLPGKAAHRLAQRPG